MMTLVARMARADTLRLEAPDGLALRTPCQAARQEKHMQIGFNAPTSGVLIEPDSLTRVVTEGEALGFDYVTISDHIMVPRHLDSKYPYTNTGEFPAGTQAAWLEQLATTAYVAALTTKLRFVLSVMVVPHRPAVLTEIGRASCRERVENEAVAVECNV